MNVVAISQYILELTSILPFCVRVQYLPKWRSQSWVRGLIPSKNHLFDPTHGMLLAK
jgi:hypothetical protein